MIMNDKNIEKKTIIDFGNEWDLYNQLELNQIEKEKIWLDYFSIFPSCKLNKKSVGFDFGCGSGRWAQVLSSEVKKIYCIDASLKALNVAKNNLKNNKNCILINSNHINIPIKKQSMDFGYSLGVLHHIKDTQKAITNIADLLKPGAPFLIYLYYSFENKSYFYKFLWKCSDYLRIITSRLPFGIKKFICLIIAIIIYYPISKSHSIFQKMGLKLNNYPLSYYSNKSFYTMKTDALDRFGTKLEKRFSKDEIFQMLSKAGFINIKFGKKAPYWCAVGYKK